MGDKFLELLLNGIKRLHVVNQQLLETAHDTATQS